MEREIFIRKVLPLRPRLVACARRMTNSVDEAEDIAQEALLKLWSMKGELPKYRSIAALSVQITKNLCINAIKAKQRRAPSGGSNCPEAIDEASPDVLLEDKDEETRLSEIIARLPGLQRMALRMKHVEGMEVNEIAACAGMSPEAVRMNLSRARKKVKDLFFKLSQ
jgi:RNA polymerase sigma-70 factor (ECF subfamily)